MKIEELVNLKFVEPYTSYEDLNKRAERKFALEFLEEFFNEAKVNSRCIKLDDCEITKEELKAIILLAERSYPLMFSESDYIPGWLAELRYLDNFSENLREKILNYFERKGRWIVREHIRDYREGKYKDPKFRAFNIL